MQNLIHPFSFVFFTLICERVFIKVHNIEIRFVIELENVLFAGVCVCVCALSEPEILQAGAVKGLMRVG